MQTIEKNRADYLAELRSGAHKKGTIKSDERGRPVIETEEDAEGSCACAIMHDMFYRAHQNDFRIALGIDAKQCRYIQSELNDSPLTFPEIADIIENTIFNSRVAQ